MSFCTRPYARLEDEADERIDIEVAVYQEKGDSWVISFGDLKEYTYILEFECAGDFDSDDQRDIAVSSFDRDGSTVRARLILIS